MNQRLKHLGINKYIYLVEIFVETGVELRFASGQVDLELRGWKDEGFRRQQNVELDWKEQISYRIFQEDSQTKEKSLVYEGCKSS